jgi:hypothetical protein
MPAAALNFCTMMLLSDELVARPRSQTNILAVRRKRLLGRGRNCAAKFEKSTAFSAYNADYFSVSAGCTKCMDSLVQMLTGEVFEGMDLNYRSQ